MRKCDPKGPLVVYISKLIPVDGARFAAFGRGFSGTVQSGQSVKIFLHPLSNENPIDLNLW